MHQHLYETNNVKVGDLFLFTGHNDEMVVDTIKPDGQVILVYRRSRQVACQCNLEDTRSPQLQRVGHVDWQSATH